MSSQKSPGVVELVDDYEPESGFQGSVRIADGQFWILDASEALKKVFRGYIVFHELKENYERTENGKSYDDAHKAASDAANKYTKETTGDEDENKTPGSARAFTPKPVEKKKTP